MLSLIAQVVNFFRTNDAAQANHASVLMEAADAGSDVRRAQELRAAASAWLSVVR